MWCETWHLLVFVPVRKLNSKRKLFSRNVEFYYGGNFTFDLAKIIGDDQSQEAYNLL